MFSSVPFISVIVPALRILGNIVAGNDKQTDVLGIFSD